MGRRTPLTEVLLEVLTEHLRLGNFIATSCRAAGLNPATYYSWVSQGRKEHERLQDPEAIPDGKVLPYLRFYYAVETAKAEAEVTLVKRWHGQTSDSWMAARDFLARRYPERWGKTDSLKVNLPDDDVDSAIEQELARLASGSSLADVGEPETEGPDIDLAERVQK